VGRFLLIRDPDQPDDGQPAERLVAEGRVPKEDMLHKALMRNPKLVPATDLGLGEVVTVGYEASLPSAGDADLVLLDEEGRLCIVEVKKAGNPDTRRVIAQLLDYASALWGLTIDEFERRVTRQRLDDHRSLRQFIADELVPASDEAEAQAESQRVIEALSETLKRGEFSLVVAAPTIPTGVQRVIEYLNEFGHSIYGLEVSYFAGEVEAFVPRIAVRPSLGRGSGHDTQPKDLLDREKLLTAVRQGISPQAAEAASAVLDWANGEARLRIRPATTTIALVLAGTGRRLLRLSDGGNIRIGIDTLLKWGDGWDDARIEEFRNALTRIGLHLDPGKTTFPGAPIEPLADPDRRQQFFELMERALDTMEGP
jgi:hypothetical protein